MSYKLDCSDAALSRLEALGKTDAKKLRQILMKILALRREPFPQDSKKLENFNYQGLTGHRVDQGEYRIIYAVDEAKKVVMLGPILNRNEDYKELKGLARDRDSLAEEGKGIAGSAVEKARRFQTRNFGKRGFSLNSAVLIKEAREERSPM